MSGGWLAVRALLPAEAEPAVADLVGDTGALGAEVESRGESRVVATVWTGEPAIAEALAAGLTALGAVDVSVETVGQRDWMAAYRELVRAFPIGRRWWIDPHPETPATAPEGRLRLAIEPRTAFGSGSHESTRLVLSELEDRPPTGRTVLDVGTGSGILALAAERLGAEGVFGFDLDPAALWVARQTIALQEWRSEVQLFAGGIGALAPDARFGAIVCNMVSEQFVPLLADLGRHLEPGGEIVLSGMLESELDVVGARVRSHRLDVLSERRLAGWAAMRVRRG